MKEFILLKLDDGIWWDVSSWNCSAIGGREVVCGDHHVENVIASSCFAHKHSVTTFASFCSSDMSCLTCIWGYI